MSCMLPEDANVAGTELLPFMFAQQRAISMLHQSVSFLRMKHELYQRAHGTWHAGHMSRRAVIRVGLNELAIASLFCTHQVHTPFFACLSRLMKPTFYDVNSSCRLFCWVCRVHLPPVHPFLFTDPAPLIFTSTWLGLLFCELSACGLLHSYRVRSARHTTHDLAATRSASICALVVQPVAAALSATRTLPGSTCLVRVWYPRRPQPACLLPVVL